MEFPVCGVIEQAVNNQVNALIGNKDINLNTIVKMAKLNEMKPIPQEEMNSILEKIAMNNMLEKYYIDKEYELTYDRDGNLILLDDIIDERKTGEKNTESVLSESKGSQS
jgi:hypothetical protein